MNIKVMSVLMGKQAQGGLLMLVSLSAYGLDGLGLKCAVLGGLQERGCDGNHWTRGLLSWSYWKTRYTLDWLGQDGRPL